MEFLSPEITDYAMTHSSPEPEYLQELYRETYLKHLQPRMISGPMQGRLLASFSKMIQPNRILEIGTYTGYSALCLAEGLVKNGLLFTIDLNEELVNTQIKYFAKSGLQDSIKRMTGNALDLINGLDEFWDLVFIDADKNEYQSYFDAVFDNVNKGGFIIADNVLWSGKVLDSVDEKDEETRAIVEFNEYVNNDPRVENVLLPIRDGLMIMRKK